VTNVLNPLSHVGVTHGSPQLAPRQRHGSTAPS